MAARIPLGPRLQRVLGQVGAARGGPAGAALAVFAIRIASAACAYGAQVLSARLLGWDAYGIFANVWVWTAMVGHTATLGLAQGACRFLPGDQARGDLAHARGYLLAGGLIVLGAGVGLAGLGTVLLHGSPTLLAEPYRGPVLLAACILPVFALQDYLEGVARSQNWAVLAIAPPYLLRQGVMMLAMLAAVLAGAPARAETAMACMLAAAGLAVTVQAGLMLVRLRAALPSGPRRYRLRQWLRTSLPIAAIELANAGFSFIDVVVLGFLVSPAEVGLYFAATRIQQFVVFVHFAATAAIAPRYSAAQARGDRAALAGLVRLQGQATAAATLTVAVAILAASPLLLAMFGPHVSASVPILAVLVSGSVLAALFGPSEDVLTMLGGERLCAAITLASLAAAVGLCLVLVPPLGPIGAAVAMASATVLRALVLALAARSVHGLATPVWSGLAGAAR